MTPIVQKLVIIAATDGLHLQPHGHLNQRPSPTIKICYKTNEVLPLTEKVESGRDVPSIEAHGIVGLLTLGLSSYLISISSRQQVAQIRGKPVFVVTSVSMIPLSSQDEAAKFIEQSKGSTKKYTNSPAAGISSGDDTSEDEERHKESEESSAIDVEDPITSHTPDAEGSPSSSGNNGVQKDSSVVQDVIGRKGQYGRFADRWFSKKGWSVDKRRNQGMSVTDAESEENNSRQRSTNDGKLDDVSSNKAIQRKEPTVTDSLTPKLLKTTKMLLSSNSFFFSYEYDITRRLGTNVAKSPDIPLHKCVDSLYFWNRHLATSFINAGQHAFVLPLMQGFVGQRAFTVNTEQEDPGQSITAAKEKPGEVIELQNNASEAAQFHISPKTLDFLITLISRRSILRPGLRYLRRGIDSNGDTANYVETEQILSNPSWTSSSKIRSFTQIRGSIPLYFSQSPYSFKPVPVLQHSYETNHAAFKRHFTNIVGRYGDIQIILLVDKSGGEAKIGETYEEHTKKLNEEKGFNEKNPCFEWFDFHNICRGMKFENVSILMGSVGSKLDEFGITIERDGKFQSTQSGIFRTNCMDCLDRTNVVQSACGQRALEQQLKSEGIPLNLQTDASTQWFNTLWADNGDAISKQYSSTAALKGDYTRTRKRDYRGAINDFGLTLSRYFNNIVNDFFSQAAIDYLLGNVTDQVFADFEANMMSGDPAMSMRKVRQSAIDTSSNMVIADQSEDLRGGWTFLAPREPNTLRTFPFEEVVLLLTDAAIYAVRFDWNMEKVAGFERVDLRSIVGVMQGVYITSTLTTTQTDEGTNVGFVVRYQPGERDVARVNTRVLSTTVTSREEQGFDGARRDRESGGRAETEREGADNGTAEEGEEEALGNLVKRMASGNFDQSVDKKDKSTYKDKEKRTELKILAFKALPAKSSFASVSRDGSEGHDMNSERDKVRSVCDEIRRAVGGDALGGKRIVTSEGLIKETTGLVEEGDIISLAEARKSTGFLEQWGHSLKKLVWA